MAAPVTGSATRRCRVYRSDIIATASESGASLLSNAAGSWVSSTARTRPARVNAARTRSISVNINGAPRSIGATAAA